MSTVLEMARRRRHIDRDQEMKPIIPDLSQPDVDMPSDDFATGMGMLQQLFQVGDERLKELEAILGDQERTGEYWIPHAFNGTYSDFEEQANYKYFKETYPWLNASGERIGVDATKATEQYPDFQSWLANIPHDSWQSFLTDIEEMSDPDSDAWIYKNEDIAQELRQEEEARWMKEDGWPELMKAMRDSAPDAYDGYLLSKITEEQVWEWCNQSGNYPEAQGDGSIWMDMDKYGQEEETRDWFLEEIPEDQEGWNAIKTQAYNDGGLAIMDMVLKELAANDTDIAYVYNQLNDDDLWKIFQLSIPDEPRSEGDPIWYFYRPDYFHRDNERETWRPGYRPPESSPRSVPREWWKIGLKNGFDHLATQFWWLNTLRSWKRRGPEGHPEFEFESLERQPDPDDPEIFVRHGGGLREELVYEDDKIVVYYPNDLQSLNWHLRRAGMREINQETWNHLFKYNDIFVIVGKEPQDLLGKEGQKELGVLFGSQGEELQAYNEYTNVRKYTLENMLADPVYGRSIRRMLLRYYRERGEDSAGRVFLQVGGAKALRRAGQRGQLDLKYHTTMLGLYYVAQRKYQLAAKTFGRDPSTVGPKGVQLVYNDISDLTDLFKNPEAASDVFQHETWDWFDHYTADVDDVVPFLSEAAMKHIREVLVNRMVWFPDAGPEQQGDYVRLTTELLNGHTDEEILDWIVKPSPEDEETEVFSDIRQAFQDAGADILRNTAQDSLYSGYVKEAVEAIGGKDYQWIKHPTKAGQDAFAVFVPWETIREFSKKYQDDNNGQDWTGSLENLALEANWKSLEPDTSRFEPSWRDVNKEYTADWLQPIFDLEQPEFPEDPNQVQLPLGEGIDDPDAMPDMLSGVATSLASELRRDLDAFAKPWGLVIHDFKVTFEYEPYGGGMSFLKVAFKPEGAWLEREGVLVAHDWDKVQSRMTGNIVRAYQDSWQVMNCSICDEAPSGTFAPPGYIWFVWPMHKRNDPDLPF